MTDVCPKCGRPQGDALNREPGPWFRCEAHIGDEIDAAYCDQVAAAYQRGRRDGIDEGVRIAKEWVEVEELHGHEYVNFENVERKAEKAKERTR